MGAKGFFLVLLLFAVVGAGAGYGAAQLVPAEEEEQVPVTADLVAPGGGGEGAEAGAGTGRARQTGGQRPSVDDVMATMPEEARRELENNPELAAQVRARIQADIDSGAIPPEVLQELAGGGVAGAPGAGAGAGTQDTGARNAEPLAGTVVSFEGGMLRLETPDGEAAIALPDDAPVNVTKAVVEAQAYLADGTEVSVIARPDETGVLTAAAIVVGSAGQGAGGGRGLGGQAAVAMGSIGSFVDGVLTLATADGPAEFAVGDDTPVRITTTAADAASELTEGVTVTAFVQREADGSLSAASVRVGAGGGFGRGGFGGGGQRGGGQGGGGGG
ncbi:MAG: hypothetical protein OXL97_15745 [Chloroflexota bacterium]|nr:hypothetical protein [Chloroflexota bacterium]MDE2884579.1 hypothetical protein [Chloroflexota bacterium]